MNEAQLLIATTNPGKAREIKNFLASLPLKIITLDQLRLKQSYPETETSFLKNAQSKSLFYSRFWPYLTLAEDSGLEIEYLGGRPGVLSARFSGPAATDATNIEKVLKLMEGVPWSQRKARFVSCLVLSQKQKILKEIIEKVEGYITSEKKGEGGFGYDPIFYYPPFKKTFAQLSTEEKNKISHRGLSLTRLKEYLLFYLTSSKS